MRTLVVTALVALLNVIGPPASVESQPPGQIVPSTSARPLPPRDQQPETGTSVVKGYVLDAATGNPIQGARVTLLGRVSPDTRGGVQTDSAGRFELRDVPAGRYTLNVTKSGYLSLRLSNGGKPLPPLSVGQGETVEKVILRLMKGGVIVGRVVDEFGEALAGADMRALRYGYADGRRQLLDVSRSGFGIVTDDLGGFRIYGLEPGDYFVSARPRSDDFSFASPSVPNDADPTQTYYPGTTDSGEARRVTVRAGRETPGVTFATVAARLAHIRGRAVTSTGEPLVAGGIAVIQRIGGGTRSTGAGIRPDGTFEVGNLAAGTYLLTTRPSDTRAVGTEEVGRLLVSVSGEDLNDVLLVGTIGGIARGRVVTDEGVPPPFAPGAIFIDVAPVDPNMPYIGRRHSNVHDDGTFEINGLFDRMNLRSGIVTPASSPAGAWSFKSILLDGQDVTDSGIEFRPGRAVENIAVVYTRKSSQLSGTVHADRASLPDVWVVLFAADESRWAPQSRWIRATKPGLNGQYRLSPVPSDDYLIVAVTGLEDGQWADPEFLKSVRDLATRVSIGESGTQVRDVKIVDWRK